MIKRNMVQTEGTKNEEKKTDSINSEWINKELEGSIFKDDRLNKRFKKLCHQLWTGVGQPIPFSCQDWAGTKAAYRFFSNKRFSENEILNGHFQSTKERVSKERSLILILQDTTEFSYERERSELIGSTHITQIPRKKDIHGKAMRHTQCGILMHSSLALTTEGLPLGIAAIKFWTRKKFKGGRALKNHINATRVPIEEKESYRWLENMRQSTDLLDRPGQCVHIGDRENDIYEFFCKAKEIGTHFVVRTCVDRLAGDGKHTIANEMEETCVKGLHCIEIRNKKEKPVKVFLEIKYRRIKVLPPIGKQKKYLPLDLTVIHAEEREQPKDRERIVWKLITDYSVTSRKQAIEKINWYALRWKIEVFHKILKSGCKAEEIKLRTAERLTKLISVFCILSWRIFWMTMINRCCPNAPSKLALTDIETHILDQIIKKSDCKNLSDYLIKIAKLGGYLGRASDPPPGNIVMWRGLRRLTDIQFGFNLAQNCG